jgi:hypothetical protein
VDGVSKEGLPTGLAIAIKDESCDTSRAPSFPGGGFDFCSRDRFWFLINLSHHAERISMANMVMDLAHHVNNLRICSLATWACIFYILSTETQANSPGR